MATVKFYQMDFPIYLYNLPIRHLHKLISLSINRIQKNEAEAVFVQWCIVVFLQVDYCVLKPEEICLN